MRKPIAIGNWKMHKTVKESIRLVTELKNRLSGKQEVEVVVAPTSVALETVRIALQDVQIGVAAQNVHWEESGAFTGEVSAAMLADIGCTYVIIGHSERRQQWHETDAQVQLKFKAAIEQDLVPIVCIGETWQQRQDNETEKVIDKQLNEILVAGNIFHGSDFLIAYEPIWAIGTGNNATPEQAQKVHEHIREYLARMFRGDVAEQVRIVYGGSVTAKNSAELWRMPDVDGLLVGTASLEAESFSKIVLNQGER